MDAGLIAVTLIAFYLLPGIIAFCREHSSTASIIALNLLVGWTLLGWILAFVWACTEPESRPRSRRPTAKELTPSPVLSVIAAIFVVVGATAVVGVASQHLLNRILAASEIAESSDWCRLELKKPQMRRAERTTGACADLAARP
jgi:hypothetical protein